jgi:hypothetical protein
MPDSHICSFEGVVGVFFSLVQLRCGTPDIRAKEAHRVRVQTRVRFQRRGLTSPIRARTRESESKEESDLLWTREPKSKGGSDLLWTPRVRVQGGVRFVLDTRVRVQGGVRLALDTRVRVQTRVRSGKAFT